MEDVVPTVGNLVDTPIGGAVGDYNDNRIGDSKIGKAVGDGKLRSTLK